MEAASNDVIRVWLASGEQLAAIPVGEFPNVRSLKQHLQKLGSAISTVIGLTFWSCIPHGL